MKKIFFLTAMAVMVVLASCSKDNDSNLLNKEGAKATLSIKMAFPLTYADETATTKESKVNTVHVFIFDAGTGDLINYVSLAASDFTSGTGNVYTAKEGIITTAGQRKVGVGINLSGAIVTEITTQRSIDAVNDQTVHDVTAAMIATDDKFVMFSTEMPDVEVKSDEDLGPGNFNQVSLSIERMAGKAALAKTNDFAYGAKVTALGSFADLEYRLMQTNKKSFLMRDPARKDPNYRSEDFIPSGASNPGEYDASVFENTTAADYKPVDAIGDYTDHSLRPAFYGAENTSNFYQKATTTYFLLRGRFSPTKFSDASGNEDAAALAGYTNGSDFWVVSDDNVIHICADAATANTLATSLGTTATVTLHEDAYSYWPVWIGNIGVAREFLRNNYYVGQVKAVNGFGEGTESAVIVSPDDPVDGKKATILCEFTVLNWVFNLADEVEVY
jgi:hypothetical protein